MAEFLPTRLKSRTHVSLLVLAIIGLASCGNGTESESGDTAAGSAGAEVESDFDASTVDVMNVDVAAGGIEPAVDPASADAGIDMLGREAAVETDDAAADDTTPEPEQN